jgi:SAM-dependent methyltransferase
MKPRHVSWGLYLRNGLGRRTAMLGERLGWDFLVYNRLVLRRFNEEAQRDAPLVVAAILKLFPELTSILDVGCGGGAFAAEFQRRGKHVIGLERSSHGQRLAQEQAVNCLSFDLKRDPAAEISEAFDLIYCFEVAEHLPAELGEKLVDFLVRFRQPIIFSAAQPGQGGTGHLNEQPLEYWLTRFTYRQYTFDAHRSTQLRDSCKAAGASHWFAANAVVLLPC